MMIKMIKKTAKRIVRTLLIAGIVLALLNLLNTIEAATSHVNLSKQYAWGTNVGWINFDPQQSGGVTVYADHLEGYAWGENIGWIRVGTHTGGGTHHYANTSNSNYGVNRDDAGHLSGYAWSTNVGWINFNPEDGGVRVDPMTGRLNGYAWAENIGWIYFENTVAITPTPTATHAASATATHAASNTSTPTATHAASNTSTPTATGTPTVTPSGGDAYESDDSCEQARPISTDGIVQSHTFHTAGDVDWAEFQATAGTEYLIEAQTPSDSVADVVFELYDDCDQLPADDQNHTFSPDVRLRFTARQDGPLYLRLNDYDPDAGGENVSYLLSVRALGNTPSPGALLLVAGRIRAHDPLQDNIHHVTNQAYRTFRANGYDDERIFYLAADQTLDPDDDGLSEVDQQLTKDTLRKAITEWAVDKVGPERALTLYLMDHGGDDILYLNGRHETVTPAEIDAWLDELEAAAPGVKVNVIVEACYSGSFINLDNRVSQPGRVVVTSTSSVALAYASAEGAIFSDVFLRGLMQGMTLYGAFEEAQSAVQEAHPDQTPWLDDNGDGVPLSADGEEAQQRGFAYAGTLSDEQWPPYIVWAEVGQVEAEEGIIEAEVRDDRGVETVWAVVYKPSYVPPDPSETEELIQETLPTVMLLDTDGDGVYSAVYEGFDEVGTYRIVVYAKDGSDLEGRPKNISLSSGSQLYLPLVIK